MSTFHLKVVTPDRLVFEGDVEQISVRTTTGDAGILAGHERYVAALGIGPFSIRQNGEKRYAAIANGFLKVGKTETTVLALTCEWSDEIDIERAKHAKEIAESRLKNMQSQREMDLAEIKLKKALNRIHVASIQK